MKNLKKLLKQKAYQEIWDSYCGFLDLTMEQYMKIQTELMEEQIRAYALSGLGKRFFGKNAPTTVEEFRNNVPFTQYEDYADILLEEDESMLPESPV